MSKVNIAIFASGEGTNALQIISKQKKYNYIVKIIVTNNPNSGVIDIARDNGIFHIVIKDEDIIPFLEKSDIKLIALAGYLKKIPKDIINNFLVLNIHPSLLPKYGGKGMYGMNVHERVLENNEEYSGITIHVVNNEYDKGEILMQQKIPVLKTDTPFSLQKRLKILEHSHYPFFIHLKSLDLNGSGTDNFYL